MTASVWSIILSASRALHKSNQCDVERKDLNRCHEIIAISQLPIGTIKAQVHIRVRRAAVWLNLARNTQLHPKVWKGKIGIDAGNVYTLNAV